MSAQGLVGVSVRVEVRVTYARPQADLGLRRPLALALEAASAGREAALAAAARAARVGDVLARLEDPGSPFAELAEAAFGGEKELVLGVLRPPEVVVTTTRGKNSSSRGRVEVAPALGLRFDFFV